MGGTLASRVVFERKFYLRIFDSLHIVAKMMFSCGLEIFNFRGVPGES
jgi:hypothetical protein